MTEYQHKFFNAAAATAEKIWRPGGGQTIVSAAYYLFRNHREFWCGSMPDIETDAEFRTGLIRALKLRKRGIRYIN